MFVRYFTKGEIDMIKYIIKRDGKIKTFHFVNISDAIKAAYTEVYGNLVRFADEYSDISILIKEQLKHTKVDKIDVESVQDIVISALEKYNKEVAAAYKEYRDFRASQRRHPIDKQILDLIENKNEFLAKENANKRPQLASTQRDLMAGTISRHLARKYMIPQYLVDAHNEGLIKIHD